MRKKKEDQIDWNKGGKELVFELAKKCKDISEFKSNYSGGIKLANNLNFITELRDYFNLKNNKTIWNKEKVIEETEKYTSYKDFRLGNEPAYSHAKKNKYKDEIIDYYNELNGIPKLSKEYVLEVIKEYKHLKELKTKYPEARTHAINNGYFDEVKEYYDSIKTTHRTDWDKEKVFSILDKYENHSQLKDDSSGAFCHAVRNGYFDEVKQFYIDKGTAYTIWSLELVIEKVKLCDDPKEFSVNYPSGYTYACRNKILFDVRKYYKNKIKDNTIWSKEKVLEQAKDCATLQEFREDYGGAHGHAKRNGYYDEIKEILPITGNLSNRLIYLIEFPDDMKYIGLTCNFEKRKLGHLYSPCTVSKYINSTGLEPTFSILTDYMDSKDASNLEIQYIKEYKESGITLLNKNDGGGLGGSNHLKKRNELNKIMDFYHTPEELKMYDKKNYDYIINKQWIGIYFPESPEAIEESKALKTVWTLEKCKDIANDYKNITQLRKKNYNCYDMICRFGWSKECFENYKEKKFWTLEEAIEECKKYNHISEIKRNDPNLRRAITKNKWADKCFPQ